VPDHSWEVAKQSGTFLAKYLTKHLKSPAKSTSYDYKQPHKAKHQQFSEPVLSLAHSQLLPGSSFSPTKNTEVLLDHAGTKGSFTFTLSVLGSLAPSHLHAS